MPRSSTGRITLRFKSGSFVAEPKKFQTQLLAAFLGSIEEGTKSFVDSYISKVARRTGRLRAWFSKMIRMQGEQVGDVYKVILKFKPPPTPKYKVAKGAKVQAPYYFGFHIPGLFKSRFRVRQKYKDPTTPGTEPISVTDVMTDWSAEIEKSMDYKFSQLGMEVKTAVKSKWYKS